MFAEGKIAFSAAGTFPENDGRTIRRHSIWVDQCTSGEEEEGKYELPSFNCSASCLSNHETPQKQDKDKWKKAR